MAKILYVASSRGHIVSFHLPYLAALSAQGHIVHGAWNGSSEPVPGTDKVHILPFEKKMTAPDNFRAAAALRKLIKKENYDALILHTSLAAFFSRLALLGLKKRPQVINMVHGYLFDDQTGSLKRNVLMSAEKLTASVTDLLITMNRWDHGLAVSHKLGRRVENVPGAGVDFSKLENQRCGDKSALRRELGISDGSFVLIYPAEFSARKSQEVLLRAMAELDERAVLILPGSGALLESCKTLAAELNISQRVIFPGHVSNMGAWYEAADAAVSASRSEGLPFNIMEAMHSGLPVIASDVKGHSDLIIHGSTGFLYPYGDHRTCADLIQRIMDNPDIAAKITAAAQAELPQYSLPAVLPQVLALYESVLPKEPTYTSR